MALNKNSKKSDKIANLYRASFYLAKDAKGTALMFLKKSGRNFGKLTLNTKKERLIWAEKILDEYKRLKYQI